MPEILTQHGAELTSPITRAKERKTFEMIATRALQARDKDDGEAGLFEKSESDSEYEILGCVANLDNHVAQRDSTAPARAVFLVRRLGSGTELHGLVKSRRDTTVGRVLGGVLGTVIAKAKGILSGSILNPCAGRGAVGHLIWTEKKSMVVAGASGHRQATNEQRSRLGKDAKRGWSHRICFRPRGVGASFSPPLRSSASSPVGK
ncbi:hypothetical protein NPX13_g11099 [Xylaria arbuscula]|uniref:Uncharacterized protein n=1 Tax=Xylaria arbuscula TaxID=114810 RepID=A0A9W8N3E9_9PEZI|nr:hypothetical protein NPX13_g11099 [Xylaria arbuscula]